MGYIADMTSRFFHPAAIEEMLSTFVPLINGTNLDVGYKSLNPTIYQANHSDIVTEYTFVSILSTHFSSNLSPNSVSSHVVPPVGIYQLVHIR